MIDVRRVLVALTSREERTSLRRILSSIDWALCFTSSFPDAEATLRASPFGVVICTARFGDGRSWHDVLDVAQRMPIPPRMIVADRLADEGLWAEVLNLGCYDLLMTPFAADEVLRVVPRAWDFWRRELERSGADAKPRQRWRQSPGKTLAAGGD